MKTKLKLKTRILFTVIAIFAFQIANSQTVFWSNDFSNPSDWVISNEVGNSDNWVIGTQGPQGSWAMSPIHSPTASNGFALFDSDYLCSGNQIANLTNALPVNCQNQYNVKLKFFQFYKKYFDSTYVFISTDQIVWKKFHVNESYINSDSSLNPNMTIIDISSIANNQSTVWIKFQFYSPATLAGSPGCGFSWMIDDIKLESEDNNASQSNNEMAFYHGNGFVNSIICDNNTIWGATWTGLVGVDRLTNEMKHFYSCNCGISSIEIWEMKKSVDGTIWLASSNGLIKWQHDSWITYNVQNSPMASSFLSNLELDQNGNVWFYQDTQIYKFDGTDWTLTDIASHLNQGSTRIQDIAVDYNNNIWIGTGSLGLIKLDGQNATVFDTINGPSGNFIDCIEIDSLNRVWVGSTKWHGGFDETPAGLSMYDGNTWHKYDYNSHGIISDKINLIKFHNSKIWLGTPAGIGVFDNGTSTNYYFSSWFLDFDFDNEGNVWLATSNGIVKTDFNNWQYFNTGNTEYDIDYCLDIDIDQNDVVAACTYQGLFTFDLEKWENEILGYELGHVQRDPQGNFWLSGDYKLYKYNGSSLTVYDSTNFSFLNSYISDICVSDSNDIWLTNGSGIIHFTGNNTWEIFDSTIFQSAHCITEDINGKIWVGTQQDGLASLNGTNWEFFNSDNGFPFYDVYNCYIAPDQIKWLISDESSLYSFDGISFIEYNKNNSNLKAEPLNMKTDNAGVLWVTSRDGLYKFNGYDFECVFTGYSIHDIDFDSRGNIWLATVGNGLLVFKEGGVSLDITGNVWNVPGSAPVNNGNVYLFNNTNLTGGYDTVAVTPINPDGSYIFANQANCSFIIFAKPDTADFPELLPAYLGDTLLWTEADTLVALTPANADTIYCFLKPANPFGNADITGMVSRTTGSSGSSEPVKNAGIVIGNESKGNKGFSYAYTTSDSTGKFVFPNLPYGDYFIIIDYPGIPMDMANQVNTLSLSSAADSAYLEGFVNPSLITLGAPQYIKKQEKPNLNTTIYPNPVKDNLHIKIGSENEKEVQITLSNTQGNTITTISKLRLHQGANALDINMKNFQTGTYYLSIFDLKSGKVLKTQKVTVVR